MSSTLTGKAVVVTGSSGAKSIGRAVAQRFADEGAKVVVNGRSSAPDGRKKADIAAEEICAGGGIAVASYDSVGTMEGAAKVIQTCVDAFGRIDVLVNCAGNHISRTPPLSATEADLDSMIATHLKGHFGCSKAAAEQMIKQGDGGSIINFSSQSAFLTGPLHGEQMLYGTVKGGIIAFNIQLAAALEEYGINVNCVLPFSESEMCVDTSLNTGMGDGLPVPASPATQEYVAAVTAFFATEEARHITAKNVYVGGADLCIYGKLLHIDAKNRFFRKESGEPWTFEELAALDW